ncbi:hypothetical protein [Sphingomonas sp. Leaf343]|uniref:hypothetical protein n=1 Tax=Sphingomonas sp. Leaf343 TaxID=1736345 RepID=UPI0007022A26|nr:hypothetical protein [Sphingomonas sp. Leaf343]KQR81362.1 hypothetical protein ASG07_13085 [Sphingomonas sp. Leaf343]
MAVGMIRRRRLYIAGIALVILSATGTMIFWQDGSGRDANAASVRVVAGPATGLRSTAAPATAAAAPTGNAAPPMADLTVNERSEALERRPRDAIWATQTEASLRAQLRGNDVVPGAIRCTDTLCSVQGTIASSSPSDRQRIVDGLVRGRLHATYDRAGLQPMQALSIDADDAGTLHFTEYLQRK